MHSGVSLTAVKGVTSYFQEFLVMLGCLREFQAGLMLDEVEDLVEREVRGGEGGGVFGLRRCRGSVLLGSWVPIPPCALPRAVGLKVLWGPHVKWSL